MTCAPLDCRCGHCEERVLAPFVTHYNASTGKCFRFQRRLDVTGPTPQPEAEYADAVSGSSLVIERKSLVYPPDFVKFHRTQQDVSETIDERIRDVLDPQRAYRLTLRTIRGNRTSISNLVDEICGRIALELSHVHDGYTIGERTPGNEWSFVEEQLSEREYFQPTTGLIFEFEGARGRFNPYFGIPDDLAREATRLFNTTSDKFASHADATRLLVLDTFGIANIMTDAGWDALFRAVSVPPNIDEIWMTKHANITDLACGWIFQRLWPERLQAHQIFCRDPNGQE